MPRNRRFCLVAANATEETASRCNLGTHCHLTWKEVNLMHASGEIEPIRTDPQAVAEDEMEYVLRWLIPGRVLQFQRHVRSRDISAKYGEVIASALGRGERWAKVWVSTVSGKQRFC
jgi:hypothetical protein